MHMLHIIKQDPDATTKAILETQKQGHQVTVVDVRKDKNYDQIVDLIFSSDKVVSW